MKYHKIKSIIDNFRLYINSLMLFEKKENLSQKWKESSVAPIYKGHTAKWSNYRGISQLNTVQIIISNILESRIFLCADRSFNSNRC
jgi:hypothetical protein